NIVLTNQSGIFTLTIQPLTDGTSVPGTTTITLTITDGYGITTTCNLNVAVMWETPIFINDPNLESAVRLALNKPLGSLTSLDLFELTNLSASKASINSLSGLEWATNLTTLTLSGNLIFDLTPLQPLSGLRTLSLNGNQLADISPLTHLPGLTYLDLRWNWLT